MKADSPQEFSKLCVDLIRQQRRDLRTVVGAAVAVPYAEAPPTSGRRKWWNWAQARSDVNILSLVMDCGLDDAIRLLNAADDHAQAIQVLLGSEQNLMASAMTLERGRIESSLRFCYLMDATVSPVKTVLRMAAFQLEAIEGTHSTALKFGADMPAARLAEIREAMDEAKGLLEENGFVLTKRKEADTYTYSLNFNGLDETVAFNATDAATRYFPGHSFEWSVTSGAVHSSAWLLPTVVGSAEEVALSASDYMVGPTGLEPMTSTV
ncbi:MAG: hypothetical protein JWQ39_2488 [Glaciihabitans sp.]|nr:hypothetical protein [Glaciihabitans sp.]